MFSSDDHPRFDALRAENQSQYGLGIAYIKGQVEPGIEYANEVARAVLSERGAYFQLAEMPEEFAGALGEGVAHRLLAEAEARDTVRLLERLTMAVAHGSLPVRALSFYALYPGGSLRTCRQMFVLDYKAGFPPFMHGAWQPGVVPRFWKLRLDAGDAAEAFAPLGLTQGVQFFLTPAHTDDGRSLLATFTLTSETRRLSASPASAILN